MGYEVVIVESLGGYLPAYLAPKYGSWFFFIYTWGKNLEMM